MPARLTKDEKVEIILLCGKISSFREVAKMFNEKYLGKKVTHASVSRLLKKFKDTGSVLDVRKQKTRKATNEEMSQLVINRMLCTPKASSRNVARSFQISQRSVLRILKREKFHPFKLQYKQKLTGDDPDRRLEFCEWLLSKHETNPKILEEICWSDEASFFMDGQMNTQNCRYWSRQNPHWISATRFQGSQKVNVWCGLLNDRVIGPFFIDGNMTSDRYLELLQAQVGPTLEELPDLPETLWFQQDGAPPHYGLQVREFLNQAFPETWIGRRGPVAWPPRSPDLTPLDFFFWGFIKHIVFASQPTDLNDLKKKIVRACARVTPQILNNVRNNLFRRLNLCHSMRGIHFEHLI
jgi:transposase